MDTQGSLSGFRRLPGAKRSSSRALFLGDLQAGSRLYKTFAVVLHCLFGCVYCGLSHAATNMGTRERERENA
jgi:hypothetical protein